MARYYLIEHDNGTALGTVEATDANTALDIYASENFVDRAKVRVVRVSKSGARIKDVPKQSRHEEIQCECGELVKRINMAGHVKRNDHAVAMNKKRARELGHVFLGFVNHDRPDYLHTTEELAQLQIWSGPVSWSHGGWKRGRLRYDWAVPPWYALLANASVHIMTTALLKLCVRNVHVRETIVGLFVALGGETGELRWNVTAQDPRIMTVHNTLEALGVNPDEVYPPTVPTRFPDPPQDDSNDAWQAFP